MALNQSNPEPHIRFLTNCECLCHPPLPRSLKMSPFAISPNIAAGRKGGDQCSNPSPSPFLTPLRITGRFQPPHRPLPTPTPPPPTSSCDASFLTSAPHAPSGAFCLALSYVTTAAERISPPLLLKPLLGSFSLFPLHLFCNLMSAPLFRFPVGSLWGFSFFRLLFLCCFVPVRCFVL